MEFPLIWQLLTDEGKLKKLLAVLEELDLRIEEVREYPYFNIIYKDD